jgi:hypothetical protein
MWYKRLKFFLYIILTHVLLIACISYTDQTHPYGHYDSYDSFLFVYGFMVISTFGLALRNSVEEIYEIEYWPFVVPTLIMGFFLSLQSTKSGLLHNLLWTGFAIFSVSFSATFGSLLFSWVLASSGVILEKLPLRRRQARKTSDPHIKNTSFDPEWHVRLPYDEDK